MWRKISASRLGRDAAILRVNELAERESKRAPRNKNLYGLPKKNTHTVIPSAARNPS
jgi:hypothetical protein